MKDKIKPMPQWNFSRLRRFRWGLVALFIVIGAAFAWGWRGDALQQNKKAQQNFVRVVPGTIEETVTAQGRLESKEYVDVGAQVSGQLKKIHVEVGDVVKAGDLLAEIDPRIYQSRVEGEKARITTLQAQLAEQQAQVAFARSNLERNKKLIAAKAISQEALEDSETSLKVAESRLTSLRAQIEEAKSALEENQTNLGYTKIYAPISGTVITQTAREGQTLNASQQAPTLLQLANLDTMTVRAQVAEADVMRLKSAMPVYFTTLGSLERKWEGTIRQILPSPVIISDVVLYEVLVDVDNKDRQLMTGMSTQMFFQLGKAENVPVIPVAALGKRVPQQDTEAGQAYIVRVKEGANIAEKTVHIGMMNRNLAEIKDGISLGDEVAVGIAGGENISSGSNQQPRFGGPRL
ncbi:MAG: efflux RND transporter periplasmic adaptor subunit [Dongiaceae bacterium]